MDPVTDEIEVVVKSPKGENQPIKIKLSSPLIYLKQVRCREPYCGV